MGVGRNVGTQSLELQVRTELKRQQERDMNCYEKAVKRSQRTFTVVEQDISAPKTILFWIMENWETAPTFKLEDAFETAIAMRDSTVVKKRAD